MNKRIDFHPPPQFSNTFFFTLVFLNSKSIHIVVTLLCLVGLARAQTFKGKVYSYSDYLNSTLEIKSDSSLVWVQALPKNSPYLVYKGKIKRFHDDIFLIQTQTYFNNVGWGLLDEQTGLSYPYAQVLIDSMHRAKASPVFIVYSDGSQVEYLFKGQQKLDTLKLNATHPTYTVHTNFKDPFTQKTISCVSNYTQNTVMSRDTSGFSILVRFRNDSIINVPTSRYKLYNMFIHMRRVKGKPVVVKKSAKQVPPFNFPDMQVWRKPGDSLIYEDEIQIKYGTDTLREKSVKQYCNGKYMGEYRVVKENGITDSSLYLNRYDSAGKHIGVLTRWHQALTCDSSLNGHEEKPYWGYDEAPIPVERISFPCPRYSYSIISYSKKDTIGVKCVEDYNHEYKIHTFNRDTTWYFRNGLKHLEKHYNDSSLNHVWLYHYVFDQKARLQKYSVRVSHLNGYEVSMLYTVNQKDTMLIKTTTRYQSDSTQGQYTMYCQDPKSKIYWFKNYYNNQLTSYAVSLPFDSLGCTGYIQKSFNKDSVLVGREIEYNCNGSRKSKGRFEQWSTGRYAVYQCYDTVKVSTGFIVKRYVGYPGSYPNFEMPPLNKCTLDAITTLDQFRRPLMLTEYDRNQVKRKIKFRYSK